MGEWIEYVDSHRSKHVEYRQVVSKDLPVNLDGRTEWPGCIHPVLNQGDCGSCWAFAATEVLSDRFCIDSNKNIDVVLSPQNLLSCESLHIGCLLGSLPMWAWDFLEKRGVTTMSCVPYVSGDGKQPKCTTYCTGNQRLSTYIYFLKSLSRCACITVVCIQSTLYFVLRCKLFSGGRFC